MNQTAYCIITAGLILSSVGYAAQANSTSKSTVQTQWIHLYSQDNWTDHRPKLIESDSTGFYVVGESTFRRGKLAYDRMLWAWKMDNEGNRLWSKPLLVAAQNDPNKIAWNSNFICLKNECLVLINETEKKATFRLIRFDENGQITLNKKLAAGGYSHVLRDIAAVQDGYLVAGQELKNTKNTNAFVLKIDFDGNELWQKIYDRGQSEDAMSIAVSNDGGFMAAANSGQYNKFGAGQSEIWIIQCDKTGAILAETTFTGRHPKIEKTLGGTYAITYNTADFPSVDMFVSGLDENCRKTWDTPLYKGNGLGVYEIAADPQGNFIVAGSKFSQLGLWKIDRKGHLLWDASFDNKQAIAMVELLVSDRGYMFAGSASQSSPMPRDENNKPKEDEQWDILDILVAHFKEANTE